MNPVDETVAALRDVFRRNPDKYEAHRKCVPILEQASRQPEFMTDMLRRYLEKPQSLNRGNYPAVGIEIDLNPWFGISANCWIPLPDGNTNLSTKAIHHHGDLLLTTVTLFGPGYEHWTFTTPEESETKPGVHKMQLLEVGPHPQHHVAFVDRMIPHTPFFPPKLSITLALFSSCRPAGWRDRVKRLPGLRGRERQLRQLLRQIGLTKALDLKIIESHDYYPTAKGFEVMRDRKEFELGPVEDHVASVFHILQETGNEQLAPIIRGHLDAGAIREGRAAVEELLPKLEKSRPISGKLSPGHYDRPYANFTREDIQRSVLASEGI